MEQHKIGRETEENRNRRAKPGPGGAAEHGAECAAGQKTAPKIPCELIQDLLPLYVDGLTCTATNLQVEEHLMHCEECRGRYQRMKESLGGDTTTAQETEREIDYLKKIRRRSLRKILVGAAVSLTALLAAAFLKLFVIGYPVSSYAVTYLDVNGEQLSLGGVFYDSASVYSRYRLVPGEGGETDLVIYACLPSAWNRDGVFNLSIDLAPIQEALNVNGATVKKGGAVISRLANDLYAARNPYVGNASANGRIALLLGISNKLGNYTNELQTSREPYGWTLHFEDGVSNSALFEERMRGYACVMIALVDNLSEVSWTYTVETEGGPVAREGRLTKEECTKLLQESVKNFSESPKEVQRLLENCGVQ